MSEDEDTDQTEPTPMDRETANTILEKLGVSNAAALPDERVLKKLTNRLSKEGATLPAAITDEEKQALEGAGFPVPPTEVVKPTEEQVAATPGGKRRYGLKDDDGNWSRIEEITEVKAKVRNQNRDDTRKWQPVPDGEDVPTEGAGESDAERANDTEIPDEDGNPPLFPDAEAEDGVPTKKESRTVKTKTSKTTKPKKGQPVANPKALTPQKAAKLAEAKKLAKTGNTPKASKLPKEEKTPKPVNTPKSKGEKGDGTNPKAFGNDQKDKKVNASQIFRDAFATDQVMKKAKVVEGLVKKGLKPATVSSYLVWAKRKDHGTPDHANPWGFVIVEDKDAKGEKTLQRVGKTKGAPAPKTPKADKPAVAKPAKKK